VFGIPFNLLTPKRGIGFRPTEGLAIVLVPEAAVYKYCGVMLGKD